MKKGINIIWISFTLLSIIIVILSQYGCIHYVATGYEGLAIAQDDDGQWGWQGINNKVITELPEPRPISLIRITLFPAIFGAIVFLFNIKFLHIIELIAKFFEILLLFSGVRILNFIDSIDRPIGGLVGYYEITTIGIVTITLSILSMLILILMTIQYIKEKRYSSADL